MDQEQKTLEIAQEETLRENSDMEQPFLITLIGFRLEIHILVFHFFDFSCLLA